MFELNVDHEVGGYVIPMGYRTDFASVPRFARFLINQTGKHDRAALIHDWEYDNQIGTRWEADKRFYREMRKDGVHVIKASLMFCSVWVGGRKWWISNSDFVEDYSLAV